MWCDQVLLRENWFFWEMEHFGEGCGCWRLLRHEHLAPLGTVDILGHVGLKLQAAETKTRKAEILASYLPDPANNWMISIQIVATYAFVSASFVVMK